MRKIYLKTLLKVFCVVCIATSAFLVIFTICASNCERKNKVSSGIFPTSLLCGLPLHVILPIKEFKQFQKSQASTRTSIVKPFKSCLNTFLSAFQKHEIPLFLLDKNALSELLQLQTNFMDNPVNQQKILQNFCSSNGELITFALEAVNFQDKYETIVKDLDSHGYIVHLSRDVDPRVSSANNNTHFIPTHFWIASSKYVIQVALLHERLNSYMWIGPIKPNEWKMTDKILASALIGGVNITEKIGSKLLKHARAFDKIKFGDSFHLKTSRQGMHVPWNATAFFGEYENSQFIECDYKRAREYKEKYEQFLTSEDKDFKIKAKNLIIQAGSVLDKLNVPFSLSGGSCLGWYRQCDIIPYTIDVDFEILIHNYNEKIIDAMQKAGLKLMSKFGKLQDSLEYSFKGKDGIKLDIFLVYEEKDHFWLGGMLPDGQKYKYKLPMFTLCWTEFLDVKVRVPCNPEKYIEMNYGTNWAVPNKNWIWNQSPINIKTNGKWSKNDMKEVFNVF